MQMIFRDLNPAIVKAMKDAFTGTDSVIECVSIFDGDVKADAIISPANCVGRMDGGIDALYVQHFGWQLQARLSHHLIENFGGLAHYLNRQGGTGRVDIGQATSIYTHNHNIPVMIMAPTMDWTPGDVSKTENAYRAFKAALLLAKSSGYKKILTPGLGTLSGRIPAEEAARQMRRAWDDVCA